MTLHWDGQLLPVLSTQQSKEECSCIVISYGFKEQLNVVPRMDSSIGKEQIQAIWKAIID